MTVVVHHTAATPDAARALRNALVADNPPYVTVEVRDREMTIRLAATSAASARATLEDLLACVRAAEGAAAAAHRGS